MVFLDYSDYSKTGENAEAPFNQNTLVYKDLEDFSSFSCLFKSSFPRHTNVIECKSSSNSNKTYFKYLFSMYPIFFLQNDQWVESYVSLSKDKTDNTELMPRDLNLGLRSKKPHGCSHVTKSFTQFARN